jgi:hypothetical protein
MVKLFRIKKKGLRYTVSSIVLLVMIVAIVAAAIGICFGIGYVLDAKGIDWWNKIMGNDDGDKSKNEIFLAGLMTLAGLFYSGFAGLGFACGTKAISDKWFNSVGNKKK